MFIIAEISEKSDDIFDILIEQIDVIFLGLIGVLHVNTNLFIYNITNKWCHECIDSRMYQEHQANLIAFQMKLKMNTLQVILRKSKKI